MQQRTESFEHMELKYCERCGGLWLRRRGSARAYCNSCFPKMADLPDATGKRRGARVPRLPKLKPDLEGSGLELFGVAEGGRP